MPPVDPIRNVQATPNATNPAGQDPLGARNERRGGGGAGGGQKQPPAEEPEAEAWPPEEGPHLEGDALATRRLGSLAAQLDFGDELPWEQRAPQQGARPKGAGLKGARPGTAPLGRPVPKAPVLPPSAPPKAVPPPQLGGGRRVEAGYDPTAALTHTLSALQGVGRVEEGPAEEEASPPGPLPPGGLAKPLAMLRERAAQAPRATPQRARQVEDDLPIPEGGGSELAFDFLSADPPEPGPAPKPEGRVAQALAPGARRPQGTGALPQRPGEPAPKGPQPSPGPKARRPGEGALPTRQATPPPQEAAPTANLARPTPEKAPPPARPAAEAVAPQAPPAERSPAPPVEAPSPPPPMKEARKPSALDAPPPAPTPPSDAAALMVRVVDLRSNAGLAGARLELEPVENERLPTLPGQADAQGWWVVPRIPPGLYRLTARHPGKVPTSRDLALAAGALEDVGLVMASP